MDKHGETDFSWSNLLQDLNFERLQNLKSIFKSKKDGVLTKPEFSEAITTIFDNLELEAPSENLYEEIIKVTSEKSLKWSNFLDFLATNLDEKPRNRAEFRLSKIFQAHIKNETVIKIVLIETEKYFCYAMVSKYGRVGLYDGNLNFLTSYHLIFTREDINRKEEERRRRNRWITDAVFCPDTLIFLATNSARSLVFYEASGLKHLPLWLILTTPDIVQCLSYKNSGGGRRENESVLFMGNDKGKISSLTFLKPKTDGFLRRKYNDNISLFYWEDLVENEGDFVVFKNFGDVHNGESVRFLEYFPNNRTLLSCSGDSNQSVVLKYVENSKSKPYIFKIPKGSNCFALSRMSKILITGSDDGTLRLWNSIIISKPIAILKNKHMAKIVDIEIMENQEIFISCSQDAIFKSWDLKTQKNLQTIEIKFPCFKIFGKLIEWDIKTIYPGPKRHENNHLDTWERSEILITCCNHIAKIKIDFKDSKIQDNFENKILPPPPLQNSVLIPKFWKVSDNFQPEITDSTITDEKLIPDEEKVLKHVNDLKFILERDLLGNERDDINFKIANLENRKLSMQKHVERGAPYLALDLHEIEEFKLTADLPTPNRKKTKNLVEKLGRLLEDASSRDAVFSDPSTSSRSPRSSRSSVIEFPY